MQIRGTNGSCVDLPSLCWHCKKKSAVRIIISKKLGLPVNERTITLECEDCDRVRASGRIYLKTNVEN